MSLFDWLLAGHLVGDFLLQTSWMAQNKARVYGALLLHAAVYTLAVGLLALPAGGLPAPALAILFATHAFLDRRTFVQWWVRRINRTPDLPWLSIMVDQTWHLLVLALIAWLVSHTRL